MAVVGRIFEICEKALEPMGYELIRVLLSGKHRPTLQVMIDRLDQSSVSIEDCVKVSHHLSVMLDVEDPISQSYELEVSSPGLDRPLTKLAHFHRFVGEFVKVETRIPLDGQRKFQGRILFVNDPMVTIEVPMEDDDVLMNKTIDFNIISKARISHKPPHFSSSIHSKSKVNK